MMKNISLVYLSSSSLLLDKMKKSEELTFVEEEREWNVVSLSLKKDLEMKLF